MGYSKKIIGAVILGCSLQIASAQTNYRNHTLKQGETLSMLAQQYNTTVGDIMRMNGMHADTKLVYGSKIKIPATQPRGGASNTGSDAPATAPAAAKPASSGEITHIVAKGETLYSISKKFNVSLEQLRAWNNLADDNVKLGTLLIVDESGLQKFASHNSTKPAGMAAANTPPQKEPALQTSVENAAPPPVQNTVTTTTVQPAMEAVSTMSTAAVTEDIASYSGEGFFAAQFKNKKSRNLQQVSGVSKTFKTASGWSDGKFYILANDIEPGTIVKLSSDNGKAVYAKVLWNMGDMKENAGINFRISNATAAALQVGDRQSFNLNVSF